MDETRITDLPEEVLRIIFSKLSTSNVVTSVVEVCFDWKSVVDEDILFWERLTILIDCNAFINRTYLNPLSLQACTTVEGVEKNLLIPVGDGDLKKVSKARNIRFWNFNRSSNQQDLFLVRILELIGNSCENIVRVQLINCLGVCSTHFMEQLGKRYKEIYHVEFGINSVYMYPYSEIIHFPKLQTFITMDYSFKAKDLCLLADSCPQLKCLWIINSIFMKDVDLISFLDKRKNEIEVIGIGFRVTDNVLNKIEECKKLQVLFVNDSRGLSEAVFDSLNKLECLKYVFLDRAILKPEAIALWILSSDVLTKLYQLHLSGHYYWDKEGLRRWADDIHQKCRNSNYVFTETKEIRGRFLINIRRTDVKISTLWEKYWS